MYDTAERVRQVQLRAGELHRKRENRFLSGLTFLCTMLAFTLIETISVITDSRAGDTVSGLYGTMLLYDDAGSYVLTAVLAFTIGVVITVLCIRHKGKEKFKGEQQ